MNVESAELSIRVVELIEQKVLSWDLGLKGKGADVQRRINHARIQKSGLGLAGHMHGIVPTRVQILGETEMSYLDTLDASMRRARLQGFFALQLSCVVLTRGIKVPADLEAAAAATQTPLLVSGDKSSRTIHKLHSILDELLAPRCSLHGVLLDLHGVGTLLLGPSGIGKSECALALVERGHRLVADDQVNAMRLPSGVLVGRAPVLLRHHLEIRGIGILNMRELFGATSVAEEAPIQLVIELDPWSEEEDEDRLGIDPHWYELLDAKIPKMRIPVRPGRNMAVILEAAARHQLLRQRGFDSSRAFVEDLSRQLGVAAPR